MKHVKKLMVAGALMSSAEAFAHGGHGSGGSGLWHYLLEPLHLLSTVAVISGLVGMLFLFLRQRRQQR